jgi:hypothetical protein
LQTAGLTLEEIGAKFGDKVEIEFQTALEGKMADSKHIESNESAP